MKRGMVATVLMDLSKAYNYIPHDLIINKIRISVDINN